MSTRRLGLLVTFVTTFMAFAAEAAERMPFDATHLAAAQDTGKPILIHISATCCPTCKRQTPNTTLMAFDVDFDRQEDAACRFDASTENTLIAFGKQSEDARFVGDTDPSSIARPTDRAAGPRLSSATAAPIGNSSSTQRESMGKTPAAKAALLIAIITAGHHAPAAAMRLLARGQ